MSVLVMVLTKRALVETGEQRSPYKAPARMAPPVQKILISMAEAMLAQITPIVAAVPKEVPVRVETTAHRINVSNIKTDGWISFEA